MIVAPFRTEASGTLLDVLRRPMLQARNAPGYESNLIKVHGSRARLITRHYPVEAPLQANSGAARPYPVQALPGQGAAVRGPLLSSKLLYVYPGGVVLTCAQRVLLFHFVGILSSNLSIRPRN